MFDVLAEPGRVRAAHLDARLPQGVLQEAHQFRALLIIDHQVELSHKHLPIRGMALSVLQRNCWASSVPQPEPATKLGRFIVEAPRLHLDVRLSVRGAARETAARY